ncbi:LytTR family DNA-binding domain-containing protein [Fodinicurvata halophila]|uniref:LytTR family DNA-binding domain-containing protein n=1 Tax=Fodinicurvata halophila TaxID=1419723 RepID=A0ABV8UKF9_9PROT
MLDAFTKRERTARQCARLAAPVVVGLLLGLLGPFGTYELLPLLPRLAYWLSVVSLNWLLCDLAIRYSATRVSAETRWGSLLVPLGGSFLVSLPATGVVHMANTLAGMERSASLLALYWKVLLLCAVISVAAYAWANRRRDDEQTVSPEAEGDAAGEGLSLFLERLPGPLPGRLVCLEMQDHYLAVHTTGGSELILCRMEDAARELQGLGQRVHRSWWVAQDAVVGTEREGQRQFLQLRDGRSVPVGRTYRARLKQAGLLS